MHWYCTNVSVLLEQGIATDTTLAVEDGRILAIGGEIPANAAAFDAQGGLLVPGAVDLHCDALEKLIESRPGVQMPQPYIMPQAEALYASAGITTIYHAVSFAENEFGVRSLTKAAEIATDIKAWAGHGAIDHRLHARYEVSDAGGLDVVRGLIDRGEADLVSVMDHSPGQGQFQTFEAFNAYYGKAYKMSEDEVRALAEAKSAAADAGWKRAVDLIRHARTAGVAVASHDDDSAERIAFIRNLGGTISEFPVNLDTAREAHHAGLATVMGAPNIVRGGSQSGNMRALDAVLAGVLDCLCADYVPWTMLAAACMLPRISALDLPAAMAMVSSNPAQAAGLHDRGVIAPGKRADLVLLGQVRDMPQVVRTWCGGRLAFAAEPPQRQPWSVTAESAVS